MEAKLSTDFEKLLEKFGRIEELLMQGCWLRLIEDDTLQILRPLQPRGHSEHGAHYAQDFICDSIQDCGYQAVIRDCGYQLMDEDVLADFRKMVKRRGKIWEILKQSCWVRSIDADTFDILKPKLPV
ncbi:hypothetical protein HDV00_000754 [Rhizophlyctis rosea]|nr:hypothetical protein HDV00_000754 [Rhizophlyctis rosea]